MRPHHHLAIRRGDHRQQVQLIARNPRISAEGNLAAAAQRIEQRALGVRRGGTGLASLRQAFHAAGARFVLASLWRVNDVHAEELMADFYTRLWKQHEDPAVALRGAKQAAKQRGVPFRDWAGWMISGT